MSEEGITPALPPLGLESVLILMLQLSLALFEVVTEVSAFGIDLHGTVNPPVL